ncbi:HD-GYP domain-containing protein [Halobacteriovorax sp. HLS]|uniref:HD-GYP domain-containing protein n=1 Tax=Halobacteriovorax sp. HLS TaxID=2234000 RepID=UPI000FD7472E|nr:HD domain-containing phosphohydrolase [Halobacteriovorax sp. HLS]
MKILVAQSNLKQKDRFNLYLDNLPTNVEVFEVANYVQLQSSLEQMDDIDLVIASHDSSTLEGMKISTFISQSHECDLIVNSDSSLEENFERKSFDALGDRAHQIENKINCESFHNLILDILKRRKELNFAYTQEKYRKVRLIYFLRFNRVLCDVFIKIGEDKFVKVLKKDDIYTREDLQKYRDKEVKYLYIDNDDYDDFGAGLAQTPFLIEDKSLSAEFVEDAVINTLDIVHEMVAESGVTEEVLNLVDYTVFQIENNLDDDRVLGKLLDNFRGRKDYILDHSYMMAYFSNSICSHMDWDSEEIRKKLSYAAILQDLTVSDAKIAYDVNLQTAEMINYSVEEIEIYKKHPETIAKLIANNDKIPLNVDEIVLCHHERPEGTGFPRGLSHHRVSQLTAVFIVAHVFVDELYRCEFELDKITEILERMKVSYDFGNYKKPFQGLVNVFKKTLLVG